jgi:hypothetical protein
VIGSQWRSQSIEQYRDYLIEDELGLAGGSETDTPWWTVLASVMGAFLVMFMTMAIGMGAGGLAASVFLISVLAFAALIVAGVRWCLPSERDKP